MTATSVVPALRRARLLRRPLGAALSTLLLFGGAAQAQSPANIYSYSRTSSFTYQANGMLATEVIEPGNAQSCVVTTHGYDANGNKTSATTANCSGATGRAAFAARLATTRYDAVPAQAIVVAGSTQTVAIPRGMFATAATNALGQTEARTYDPRFGKPLTLTGPNSLTTRWTFDDFGRVTRETRADGTSTVTRYCMLSGKVSDVSSNTTGCATPASGEAPADAIQYVHTEPRDRADKQSGPFVRTYTDRLGREVRSVTQSFDGPVQTAGRAAALVVRDIAYNVYGVRELTTQPYFLVSKSTTTAGSNDAGVVRTEYDTLGRSTRIYTADPAGSQAGASFGAWGARQAALQSFAYNGLVVVETNDKGQKRTEEKNAAGLLVRVTDASGAQLAHQHDAFGNLVATKDALQNTITVAYDTRGRKLQTNDPDAGLVKYDYDALGQLVWQQTANQRAAATAAAQQTTMAYDKLGRLVQRVEPEYTSTWTYDKYADGSACRGGIGKLCESRTSHGVTRKTVYDAYGRPVNQRSTITSGPSFASALAYDANTGRLASQTYPTGLAVKYAYTGLGFAQRLTLGTAATLSPLPDTVGATKPPAVTLAAGSELWQARVVNAAGQAELTNTGNGVVGRANYDPATGRLTSQSAGPGTRANILNRGYVWDSLDNLVSRVDYIGDGLAGMVNESFVHGDNQNRLTRYTVAGQGVPGGSRAVNLSYNAVGMLLWKSDVGNYTYPTAGSAVRPHAVKSVAGAVNASYTHDANGNVITASGGKYRTLAYTSFNLPDSQNGAAGPSGSPRLTWKYDEGHARIAEIRSIASGTQAGTRTTWFMHPDNTGGLGFEHEVNAPKTPSAALPASISNRHYLSVGGQSIGVIVSTGALPALSSAQTAPPSLTSLGIVKLEYWHKDHLGSLAATSDHTGAATARYAYDPFGKRRHTTGAYDAAGSLVVDWSAAINDGTDRGFTGHEHLDELGLIHMNGRLFDPTLGVFLQADPFLQDPGNLQNYNRYAYCGNNPMTCTDPSGFFSLLGRIDRAARRFMRTIDPAGYWLATELASTQMGYMIGSVAIGVVSAIYCQGFAAVCNGVGQAAWAAFAGYSHSDAIRIGIISGATAAAYSYVGDITVNSAAMNVAGHMAVGCASAEASGGSCKSGAISAGFGAAVSQSGFYTKSNVVIATVQHAAVGGLASLASGGTFHSGAVTSAFGYLFNELLHQHDGTPAGRRRAQLLSGYEDGGITGGIFDPPIEPVCSVECIVGGGLAVRGTIEAAGNGLRLAFSGGSQSSFWSGFDLGAMEAAAARGVSLERTLGGRFLNWVETRVGLKVPDSIWNAASRQYANGATGTATATIRAQGRVWTSIEKPILERRGISIDYKP